MLIPFNTFFLLGIIFYPSKKRMMIYTVKLIVQDFFYTFHCSFLVIVSGKALAVPSNTCQALHHSRGVLRSKLQALVLKSSFFVIYT